MTTRTTQIWLILMVATGVSWWLGTLDEVSGFASATTTSVLLVLVAFFKVRLVISHFMEVRHAPMALRLLCDAWIVGVCSLVIGLYLFL